MKKPMTREEKAAAAFAMAPKPKTNEQLMDEIRHLSTEVDKLRKALVKSEMEARDLKAKKNPFLD